MEGELEEDAEARTVAELRANASITRQNLPHCPQTCRQKPLAYLQDMQAPQIVSQTDKTPLVGHVLLTA